MPHHRIMFSCNLQMDEKTLRVAYTGGLKAGGCCCSSAAPAEISLPKPPQESPNAQKTDSGLAETLANETDNMQNM